MRAPGRRGGFRMGRLSHLGIRQGIWNQHRRLRGNSQRSRKKPRKDGLPPRTPWGRDYFTKERVTGQPGETLPRDWCLDDRHECGVRRVGIPGDVDSVASAEWRDEDKWGGTHSKGAEEGGPARVDGSFGNICCKQMQGHALVAGGGRGVKEMSFQTGCPTLRLDAGGKTL